MLKTSPRFLTVVTGLFIIFLLGFLSGCESRIAYPPTEVKVVTDTLHGTVIDDPYRWLEDQESSETRGWIDAQNDFLAGYQKKFPALDKIRNRLLELNKVDAVLLPTEAGGKYFYRARTKDEELYSIFVRDGFDGTDRKLVDPHQLSEDLTKSVGIMSISNDGNLLAYNIREGGQDETEIKIMEVATGEYLTDAFPKALYSSFDIAGSRGCYYTIRNERDTRVYYHRFGTDFSKDREIFGEGYSSDKFISASLSEDRNYLVLVVYHGAGGSKTEVFLKNVARDGPVKPVVTDIEAQFYPYPAGKKLYLLTDWNAPNRRVMVTDLSRPTPKNWREIIPESEYNIESFTPVGGRLFVGYLQNVTSRVNIFTPDGQPAGEIKLPTLGSASGVYGRWNSEQAFYMFSSFTHPDAVYRYDIPKEQSFLWGERKVPVNTDDFVVEQVWFDSKDGARVPMFLVHRKDIKQDGNNACMLNGYGGFNVSMTPYFSGSFVHWVEMGGILAMVNLRGGSEFGEDWHRAGMLENKQNTFDDFIAAAEWLVDNKYTRPEKLSAMGGSNGGLLVGAALTQRPDLFQAIVCTYPLLDMLRYHTKMLGPLWTAEYGSADNAEQFEYIYKYSPYHNVKEGVSYPAVLFITGDGDTRVDPMHARKMTALLQAKTGSNNPILLHYETKIGHSGGIAVSKSIEQSVDMLGFLCWQLGLKP